MRILITFLFLSGTLSIFGQTIQIIDNSTKQPVPFVRISPTPGNPILSDLDGYFVLPKGAERLQLKSAEYRDTVIEVTQIHEKIELEALTNELEEFVVLPGINPAERIVKLAIDNRKKNHPMGDEPFTYDSYSKFIFTVNPDVVERISDTTTDFNLRQLKKDYDQRHAFMMESTTQKAFEPPYREKETITAYKVSGFSNPEFSTFANELQSFNFYDNQFNLMGRSYINPLAFGGIRRYLFILEDTTIVGKDTTYTIRFQPRKDKNFDGMKGWLYINTNGFALEKVIAEPAEMRELMQAKIVQEYVLIDGKKWFPSKLSTEAVFPNVTFDSAADSYLVGKGSTYIDHIALGADVSKQHFNAVTIETAIDANEKDSTHWNQNRKYQLTDKEKNTYKVIDSISKAEHFDRRLQTVSALLDGKIPLGYVQLDIKRLLDYRQYEGLRVGLGVETSKKLWKRAVIGGYLGYGTRDKDWKYGGYANCIVFPKYFVEIRGVFQEDLIERGGYEFLAQEPSFSPNDILSHFYVANMERQRKAELTLSGYLTPRIKLLAGANYQYLRTTQGYQFTRNVNGIDQVLTDGSAFSQVEANLEVVWTIREKLMYLGTKRVSLGSKWPRINAKLSQGIAGIGLSRYDYTRMNIGIQQDVPVRGVGKLSYLVSAGKTLGNVPLYLMQVGAGTGENWNLSVANSFETMKPSSFYNTQQLSVFTRFAFTPLKTNKKWTTPQIVLHHAAGFGTFKNPQAHAVPTNASGTFRSMENGYLEGGVLLDKLINVGFVGLGIGGFYNYYSNPDWKKNMTVKIGLSVQLQ